MKFSLTWALLAWICSAPVQASETAEIIFLDRKANDRQSSHESSQNHDLKNKTVDSTAPVFDWITRDRAEVEKETQQDGHIQSSVTLQWKSTSNHWEFIDRKGAPISPQKNGTYQLKVPLNEPTTQFDVLAISPDGTIQKEEIRVVLPQPDQPEAPPRRFWIKPAVGPSLLQLSQTGSPFLNELGLTFQLASRFDIPKWKSSLQFRGDVTVLPLTSTLGNTAIRHVHIALHATREVLKAASRWSLFLSAGGAYSTLFVTQGNLGYANVSWPELFPTLTYSLKERDQLSLALKYSPIFRGFALLPFPNHGISAELEWNHYFNNTKAFVRSFRIPRHPSR